MCDRIAVVANEQTSNAIPRKGSVLGIDVGWSTRCDTTAVCRLLWGEGVVRWKIRRCRAEDPARENTLTDVAGTDRLLSVAIDGPLRRGFDEIDEYRVAERLLTRGTMRQIGKPGQSNSPNGRKLNCQANYWARIVAKKPISNATHDWPVHTKRIVEAFPTSFLGVMIDNPEEVREDGKRSDWYFRYMANGQGLDKFVGALLPDSRWERPPSEIVDHDDRAAFVCALTALCVAHGSYVAVGDKDNGWITLPPQSMFAKWAWKALQANVCQNGGVGCVAHGR